MKIIAIGDRMTVSACRAGGISDTILCRNAEEARHALESVLYQPETGIVCVLDQFLKDIVPPPSRGPYPVIIGIPGPEGPVMSDDALCMAVRKVAGRHLPEADP